MRSITADSNLVACCGLYCGACPAYLNEKCEGCQQSKRNGWCGVKKCAQEKGISTCAQCSQYPNPMDCKKFNNFISRMMGLVFNSNRAACVEEIRQMGLQIYAAKMADLRKQTLPRS